jgi:hypothetical protein
MSRPSVELDVGIDGRTYRTSVMRASRAGPAETALVIASHNARELTRVALESIRAYAVGDHEIWVVDNASDDGTVDLLTRQEDVNVILNRTPAWTSRSPLRRWKLRRGNASYSNAIALELAARHVRSRYMFVMHNDVLVCDPNWLPFTLSRIDDQVRGVAMSTDRTRVHAMHASGFLFDFSLFGPLRMSFLPDLPAYDVGDGITLALRRAGFATYSCANTFDRPETIERIPPSDPLRAMYCDRAFDDRGHVIFAHLGRGTVKTAGEYTRSGKTYPPEWVRYAETVLLPPRARVG